VTRGQACSRSALFIFPSLSKLDSLSNKITPKPRSFSCVLPCAILICCAIFLLVFYKISKAVLSWIERSFMQFQSIKSHICVFMTNGFHSDRDLEFNIITDYILQFYKWRNWKCFSIHTQKLALSYNFDHERIPKNHFYCFF